MILDFTVCVNISDWTVGAVLMPLLIHHNQHSLNCTLPSITAGISLPPTEWYVNADCILLFANSTFFYHRHGAHVTAGACSTVSKVTPKAMNGSKWTFLEATGQQTHFGAVSDDDVTLTNAPPPLWSKATCSVMVLLGRGLPCPSAFYSTLFLSVNAAASPGLCTCATLCTSAGLRCSLYFRAHAKTHTFREMPAFLPDFSFQASAIGGRMKLKSGLRERLYSIILKQVCLRPRRTGLCLTVSAFNAKHLVTP